MKNFTKLFMALIFLSSGTMFGQQKENNIFKSLTKKTEVSEVVYSKELGTPSVIRFNDLLESQTLRRESSTNLIRDYFQMQMEDQLFAARSFNHQNNAQVQKYERSYMGIPVEHGDYSVLLQGEQIKAIYAEHYLLNDIDLNAQITAEQALEMALERIGAELYAWDATQIFLDKRNDLSEKVREALIASMEEQYPVGELVIVKDYYGDEFRVDIAYKFMIEAVEPLFKDRVYVNAHDGHIMLRDAQIKHGTGETRYAGTRTIPTTKVNTLGQDTFELRGVDAVTGLNLETRSMEGVGGLPLSVPAIYAISEAIRDGDADDPCLTDGPLTTEETGDDSWLKAEHKKAPFEAAVFPDISCCEAAYTPLPGGCNEVHNDDTALDAQWGAMVVVQYWLKEHNRSSFDNNGADIFSFVHYGDAYDNAFWNGVAMTYGDGSYQNGTNPNGSFAPLSSLDVCGHEIGHAVCSFTSDLVYERESGAMNEGFSDIWAAAIERFALDSIDGSLDFNVFGIGEQIDERDGGIGPGTADSRALRWMDDPKAEGNPDTYGGVNWQDPDCGEPTLANDYCGVHGNSGVLNKWYYLLTTGSGETFSLGKSKDVADDEMNDNGDPYSVVGIGNTKAELIAFMGETMLLQNSKFEDMRNASIDAARILYGACSNEEEQTTNAWHAVGVGEAFVPCTSSLAFGNFNPAFITETSTELGCDAQKEFNITMFSTAANETINLVTSGTATIGEDYDISPTTLTFSGTETKTIQITIYDDKILESEESIILSFEEGAFSGADTILLIDNDVIPVLGGRDTLIMEGFEVSTLPVGWKRTLINPESANDWFFNGASAPGVAYAALPGSPSAAYNQAADANIRIETPIINAMGRSNVEISFDWVAGGEKDAVEPVLFDYGTFQISSDGTSWADIEDYVGDAGGNVIASGTYSMSHPDLKGKAFKLGFRWFNDALAGSAFSFTIDNVVVSAEGLNIETTANEEAEAVVPESEQIYFASSNDGELIGQISNASIKLGCTNMTLRENDSNMDIVPATACDQRSSKVFGISPTEAGSYQATIYFKANEVNDWNAPELLNILATKNVDIDNFDDGMSIILNEAVTVQNELENSGAYISYTFTTDQSFQSFALTDRTINKTVLNANNDSEGSLRLAVSDACPNDTIFFDISLDLSTITLTGDEIIVDKNMVILGLGSEQLTISGAENSRIFNISNGVNVSILELKLVNGTTTESGGAILNNGELQMTNVILENNNDSGGQNSISNLGTIIIKENVEVNK